MGDFTRIATDFFWLLVDVIKILSNCVAIGIGSLVAFIFMITGGQEIGRAHV